MSIARFNIINSETTTLEINNTSNDNIDLCSGGGNVTINNDLNIIGFIQTPTTIDTTNTEAFLVRKDGDSGDIFTVNSSLNSVSITSSELQLNGPISGTPSLQGKYIHFLNNTFTDNNTSVSGTATNMIFNSLDQPTLTALNTSVTTTNAATMYIQGSPIAGSNQTITNSYSLWVDAGISRLDGILDLTDTTISTSSTIGTLTTSGGISISNTTDAVSANNGGTFTTAGGIGISKSARIGTDLFVQNTSWTSTGDEIFINANTDSVYLRNTSGSASGEFESSTSVFKFRNSTNTSNILEINKINSVSTFTGQIDSTNTTVSTSNTTGALILNGGIGISNTTDAVSTTDGGTFTTAGGLSVAKKIFIGGSAFIGNTLDMNNTKIINVADPTSTSDVATKNYVDSVAQGLDIKDSVIVATTVPGVLASDFENGDIIDDVTLTTGDRILIKDQASGVENGIYIVQASGSPTRSADFALGSSQSGSFTFVKQGTVNQDSGWVLTNDPPNNVVGTDALIFSQFSGAGQIIAGTGLSKSGNTLSVDASQLQITEVGTLTSLNVSPGFILGVDLKLSSLSASQAVFTNASKDLISVQTTGSGNVVLQTTPTLITPNIGVASGTSLTITGNLSSSQGIFTDSISIKNTSFTSTNNDIFLNANNDSIFFRNISGSANGEFESSVSIFKFRNSINTDNILEIDKATGVSMFSGIVDITNTTASTSSIIGALTLDGGIAISNTTDALSNTNGGTFTTAGGMAIAKSLYVGANVVTSSFINVSNEGDFISRRIASADRYGFGQYTSGTVRAFFSNTFGSASFRISKATDDVRTASATFTDLLTIDHSGVLSTVNTTASTSNTLGSVTLVGGIGISNVTDASSITNGGTFTTAGGIAVAKKAFVGGNVTIGNTNLTSGLLNVFGDLTDGGIRVIPSTSGNETSIGFYRNNDTTSVTTGDIWTIGRGQTNDRDFYIKNNTRTSLSISSVSNAVVIGRLNQPLNSNILTFGGVTGDIATVDTNLITVISERLYDSTENKFNNPSIANASSDSNFSELLILKGDETTTNIDRVRIVAPSFAIDIPSNGVSYDGQNDNITVPSGLIARAFEIQPLNRTVNVLNNNQDRLVPINPSAEDIIRQVSFTGANNQVAPADVTGLSFTNAITRSFKVQMSVVVDATTDLFTQFTLEGVQNSTGWYFISNFIGDDPLVSFTITNSGQVQYTSDNYTGFVSLTLKFKAQTIAI